MKDIFLSHAAFDSDLAIYIKTVLEGVFKGITIFCSSDPTDLPPGIRWPKVIQKSLNESGILLFLATSRSLLRPWIWFECGTFWFTEKRIIPLCLGQVRKNTLPTPLSELMGLNIDDPLDFSNLIKSIEDFLDIPCKKEEIDISNVIKSLKEKEKSANEKALKIENEGWIGVNWEGKFLSYDGPIESLNLIEDRPHQQSMLEALDKAGFKTHWGAQDRLSSHIEKGYRIIYLTDRKQWRQKIIYTKTNQTLLAKPTTSNNINER